MPNDWVEGVEEERSRFNARLGALGLSAIILAYFAAPVVSHMDPRHVMTAGFGFAVSIAFLYEALVKPRSARFRILLISAAVTLFCYGLAVFTMAERGANIDYAINLQRCTILQRDMLSARPRRDDAAELFQALGCRPRGEDQVLFPSPPSREGGR